MATIIYVTLLALSIILSLYLTDYQFKEIIWLIKKPKIQQNPLDYGETYYSTKWKFSYKEFCKICFSRKNGDMCNVCGCYESFPTTYTKTKRKIIFNGRVYHQYLVKQYTDNFKNYIISNGGTWYTDEQGLNSFIINKKF